MEHLPPWLRNVPLPPPPAGDDETPAWLRGIDSLAPPTPPAATNPPDWLNTEESVSDAAGVPDWLADLQSEVSDPLAAATPAAPWLEGVQPEPPAERPSTFGATGWLSGLGGEPQSGVDPAPEPPPTTSSRIRMPVGPTDWLRSMGHEEATDEPPAPERPESAPADIDSGVPDWLRELSEEEIDEITETFTEPPASPALPAATPKPVSPPESTFADWLDEVLELPSPDRPTVVSANDETVLASEVPEWLTSDQPALPPEPSAVDLPAWLQNIAGDEPPAAPGSVRLDLPSWLLDDNLIVQPPTTTTPPIAPDAPTLLADSSVRDRSEQQSDPLAWLAGEPEQLQPEEAAPPDWLQEVEQQIVAEPSAPAAAEAEIPTWLREADASAVSDWADEPPAPPAASAAPDWLREEAPAASDVPDWLREEAPAASAAPDWLREEASAASAAPDWLREEAPAASDAPDWLREEALTAPSAPAEAEIPTWLREADASAVSDWADEPPAPSAASDVPAWLREEAPAASDVPDWLREEAPAASDVPAWLREEAPAAASAAPDWLREEAPTASDVPAWLREEAPAVSDVPAWLREEAPAVSDVPALRGEMPARVEVTGDTPDWLAADISANDLSWLAAESSEPAHADVAPTTSSASDEFFSGADLPPWLRASTERVAETPVAPSITWLQQLSRKEIEEEEAHAVSDVVVVKPPLPAPVPRRAEDLAAMALLERLVQTPLPVSVPTEQPVSTRRRLPVLEQWLALALIVAALVGVIAPGLVTPLVSQVQPSPAAIALSEQLIDLGSDDVVLVAYEWGAQRVAELRPLEQALLNELTADRVKLIIVSTDLQGTLLSFDLIGPLRAAGYNNENGVTFGGRDYVLLGYRPGGELALRSMAIDLRAQLRRDYTGQDATAGLLATLPDGTPRIQTLNDLGMIVVLADEVQDVQIWMEQIHSAAPEVPIAFLMPQEVYPQALPYLRLPNVYAIAGQRGASDLMAAGRADDNAVAMLAYQTWATIVFVAVLVVGGLIVIVGRLRRSTRGAV